MGSRDLMMFRTQRRIGFAGAVGALLALMVEAASLSGSQHVRLTAELLRPSSWPLLALVLLFAASTLRSSRLLRLLHVLAFFAAGAVAGTFISGGVLAAVVFSLLGLLLAVCYGLSGTRFWLLFGLVMALLAAVVFASVFVIQRESLAAGVVELGAGILFLWLIATFFRDEITEGRLSAERIRVSEERLRSVVRSSAVMVANQDSELRYTWYYNAHPWLPGEDFLGKSDEDLFPAEDAAELRALKKRVIASGKPVHHELHCCIGGQDRYLSLVIEPKRDSAQRITGVSIASHEITELVVARERFARSERLIAAGELATSIAHEINSPLQGVTSLLSVIQNAHSNDPELLGNIGLIRAAFSTIRNTVRRLSDLGRPPDEETEAVNVNRLVAEVYSLTRTFVEESGARFVVALAPEAPFVRGRSRQLMQVFVDLVNYSVEEIGRVRLRSLPRSVATIEPSLEAAAVETSIERQGGWVLIRHGHTRAGAAPGDRSTPSALERSRALVEALGGTLAHEQSAREGNATVRILLPAVDG